MARLRHITLLATTVLSVLSGSATAAPVRVALSEVAAEHCAAEWAAFSTLAPDAWGAYPPVTVERTAPKATADAFNKYTAGAVAMADYFAAFLGFKDPAFQTRDQFDLAQAKYRLAECLALSSEERDLVIAFMVANSEHSEEIIRQSLFQGIDQFRCMKIDAASEAIFELDPEDANFGTLYEDIVSSTLRDCAS